MHPAKIMGRVVATKKEPSLDGIKLLLLQPTDWDGNPLDDYLIAADAVGAGDSEFVFYVESREAAVAFEPVPPIDASVCGIIDGVFLDRDLYNPTGK
jgi:microcompartment protein CcmK/EutM